MKQILTGCLVSMWLLSFATFVFAEEKEKYHIEELTPAGKYRLTSVAEAEFFCVSDDRDWSGKQETQTVITSTMSEPDENGHRKNVSKLEELQTVLTMPWATMEYDSRFKDKQNKDFIPTQAASLGVEIVSTIDEQDQVIKVEGLDKIYDKLVKSHGRKTADLLFRGFKEKPEDYGKSFWGNAFSTLRTEPKAIGEQWEEEEQTRWTWSNGNCIHKLKVSVHGH